MKQEIDYTVLAKSIPEYNKRRGEIYTCTAGWSPQLGLIRVYPMPISGMKARGVYRIEVEKNKEDSRRESWKMSIAARDRYMNFQTEKYYRGRANDAVILNLSQYLSPSISNLNKAKKSLGVIQVDHLNIKWVENHRYAQSNGKGLFEQQEIDLAEWTDYTKESLRYQAKITFKDEDGLHNLQYNEWGTYMWQRKVLNTSKKEQLNDCFRYNRKPGRYFILIGNMFQYRNVWMAFAVFSIPNQQILFPY